MMMGMLLNRPTLTISGQKRNLILLYHSFKRNKYRPKWARVDSDIHSGTEQNGTVQEIIVGPVEENGNDLPSDKNLGDYVNEKGRMDVLKFFEDHKKYFPTLWIIAQREAARRVVEVGCEQEFFGLSGYISSPRRSRLFRSPIISRVSHNTHTIALMFTYRHRLFQDYFSYS
jgi:hypothetical protein